MLSDLTPRERPASPLTSHWDLGPDLPVPHLYGYRLETGDGGVTNVTSYYDWSKVTGDLKERFPIVPDSALRATLGILERTVRKDQ
jgi:hypothetical protein